MARFLLPISLARRAGGFPVAAGFRGVDHHPSNTMRCLTNSEIHKWLAGQGMHHQPLESGVPVAGDFPSPAERRSRLMLADYLADLLSKDGNKLVEILPGPRAGIEESASVDRFRTARLEARPLIASPGHLFKSGDRNDFRSLLSLLLGSGGAWSFYIYAAPSHTTLLIGDRIEVWTPKKGVRNEIGRYLVPSRAA